MSLTNLNENLVIHLQRAGINELTTTQLALLKAFKSGQDVSLENFSLEDILQITAIDLVQRIKADETELLPRALVLCSDINTCVVLEEKLNLYSKTTGLVSVVIHDKGKKIEQRNNLYSGCDIVIGNPRRVCEMYFQNGINLKHIKTLILVDSNEISKIGGLTPIMRLNESIVRCQKIVYYNELVPKLEEFMDDFLINPKQI